MNKDNKKLKRQKRGIIVSDKMDKTVVVRSDSIKEHPKYKKKYTVSKKYKASDPSNKYKEGQEVLIEEIRPISKDKKWRVIEEIKTQTNKGEKKSQIHQGDEKSQIRQGGEK